MDHIVEMLATFVVTLAVAAFGMFGVKIEAHRPAPTPVSRQVVVARAANQSAGLPAPVAAPMPAARPVPVVCPDRPVRPTANRA